MEIPFVPMALTCSPFPATYLMTTATTGMKSTIIYYKNFYLILYNIYFLFIQQLHCTIPDQIEIS